MVKPFIQDISDIQNINPTTSFEEYTPRNTEEHLKRYSDLKALKVENYSLDELKKMSQLCDKVNVVELKYDHLSGDALRIGEAINILKLQYDSLYKIDVSLPNLYFKVYFKKDPLDIAKDSPYNRDPPYNSDLYISSEFTPRALEPIVGSILKNVYLESLGIHFKTYNLGYEISAPVASYIFNTFEEYFSTPFRVHLPPPFGVHFLANYHWLDYYGFYLGDNVLKNMGNKLVKNNFSYDMWHVPSIDKELDNFTAQELLEATLITKDINKSDSILKILPDKIMKYILLKHVGAQELGLIANRGKMNLYYDKKVKVKTIGEKKSILMQSKELIEQKRLYEEAEKQHKIEIAQLKKDYEEEVQRITADKVNIISQVEAGYINKLQEHNDNLLSFKETTRQKLNVDTVDEFSTLMLLNEHFGNAVFQNKSTTYVVELGIASVLSTVAHKSGMSYV